MPYEKGSLLLRLIEQSVGRERFDVFLRGYFDRYAFTSMDTADVPRPPAARAAGPGRRLARGPAARGRGCTGPGVPDNAPHFASDAFDIVDGQIAALTSGRDAAALDTDGWVSHQWVHFVRGLPRDLPATRLAEVDAAFGLSRSGNIEVATAWLELVIEAGYVFEDPAQDQAMADFLTRHGRALYIKTVYAKLAATGPGLERAREIYGVARPTYHSVSQSVVDRILGSPAGPHRIV